MKAHLLKHHSLPPPDHEQNQTKSESNTVPRQLSVVRTYQYLECFPFIQTGTHGPPRPDQFHIRAVGFRIGRLQSKTIKSASPRCNSCSGGFGIQRRRGECRQCNVDKSMITCPIKKGEVNTPEATEREKAPSGAEFYISLQMRRLCCKIPVSTPNT
jgi:hypothetical protein